MRRSPENDTYSPDNLVVVTVASCFSSIAVVGLFYWAANAELLMTFLIASAWCVVGNFLVAVSLIFVRKISKWLPLSWLTVPLLGTLISVFSFLIYVHVEATNRYISGAPFVSPPPPFSAVLWGAVEIGLVLSSLAILIAYCGLGAWQNRDGSTELHLDRNFFFPKK